LENWYLIKFKANSHYLAMKNLQRQHIKTFLPMEENTSRKVSRFVANLKPLFPGYMFVSVEEGTSPWRKINNTVGVSQLVGFGSNYTPIPLKLVLDLMSRCDATGKILPPKNIIPGNNIEILTGPFANFIATVEKIEVQDRVTILLEFMGHSTRVQVETNKIQLTNKCDIQN
jgi:transcriptional antiterminator RfaH